MRARLFHLHALSALHCGTGQSVGVVDLPIARDRATNLPMVPGTSIRGVLRQEIESADGQRAKTLFGPRQIKSNTESFAGALSVGDAQLLLLPVRCLAGLVSYVTSPFILRRYARDLSRAGLNGPSVPHNPASGNAYVPNNSVNLLDDGRLVLEDLDLAAEPHDSIAQFANFVGRTIHPTDRDGRTDVSTRIAVVPDEIMSFLSETATEVRARIAIDAEKGTVRRGALWYEENLPAESVMWGVYAISEIGGTGARRVAYELVDTLPSADTLLQIGGNAGIGRGLVRFLAD